MDATQDSPQPKFSERFIEARFGLQTTYGDISCTSKCYLEDDQNPILVARRMADEAEAKFGSAFLLRNTNREDPRLNFIELKLTYHVSPGRGGTTRREFFVSVAKKFGGELPEFLKTLSNTAMGEFTPIITALCQKGYA